MATTGDPTTTLASLVNPADVVGVAALTSARSLASAIQAASAAPGFQAAQVLGALLTVAQQHAQQFTNVLAGQLVTSPTPGLGNYKAFFADCNDSLAALALSPVAFANTQAAYATMLAALVSAAAGAANPDAAADITTKEQILTALWTAGGPFPASPAIYYHAQQTGPVVGDEPVVSLAITRANGMAAYLNAGG